MKVGILLMKNILTQLAKCLLIALVIPQQMQDLIKRMSGSKSYGPRTYQKPMFQNTSIDNFK